MIPLEPVHEALTAQLRTDQWTARMEICRAGRALWGDRRRERERLRNAQAMEIARIRAQLRELGQVVDNGQRMSLAVRLALKRLDAARGSSRPTADLRQTEASVLTFVPATVRKAMGYIEANANRHVSIDEVAAHAGVTPRAVQVAFRRHLGVTPLEYHRDRRLAAARQDLQSADAEATVSAIALRWGFSSHSRFTQEYRARFGELPRETLKRARAAAS